MKRARVCGVRVTATICKVRWAKLALKNGNIALSPLASFSFSFFFRLFAPPGVFGLGHVDGVVRVLWGVVRSLPANLSLKPFCLTLTRFLRWLSDVAVSLFSLYSSGSTQPRFS